MVNNNIKPSIDVTLEKGNNRRFTKKFKYEKIKDDNEIRFHVQFVIISIFWNVGW
jgi:hypothetical protein